MADIKVPYKTTIIEQLHDAKKKGATYVLWKSTRFSSTPWFYPYAFGDESLTPINDRRLSYVAVRLPIDTPLDEVYDILYKRYEQAIKRKIEHTQRTLSHYRISLMKLQDGQADWNKL